MVRINVEAIWIMLIASLQDLASLEVLRHLEPKSIFENLVGPLDFILKNKGGHLDFQKIFFLKFRNNNWKHPKNYQKVAAQNKNICPGRVSNPPQTPFKAAHFDHYASKNFFLNSKKFLAYLIEHLKIRLIQNYFLDS